MRQRHTEERSKLRSDAVAVTYLRKRNRRNICCMNGVNSWSALSSREIDLYLAVDAKKVLKYFQSEHTNNSLILSIFISFLVYEAWYFVDRAFCCIIYTTHIRNTDSTKLFYLSIGWILIVFHNSVLLFYIAPFMLLYITFWNKSITFRLDLNRGIGLATSIYQYFSP